MAEGGKIGVAQWRLFFVILVLGVAGIVYFLIRDHGLDDSAALYIGLPLILALGLSLTPKTKSAMGATMKGMTIALLLSAVIFLEGALCILFAAPIFYAVGAIIAYPIDRARKRKIKNSTLQTAMITSIVALLSLEGTTDLTTMARTNEVTIFKVLNASIGDVRTQMAKTPILDDVKPIFLTVFPYPARLSGDGLNIGDERQAKFVAYKHIFWTKVEGELVLKISQSTDTNIKFNVIKDNSYLSHYLKWTSSEVTLESIDENHTKVTWKLSYDRLLDPAWYFSPLQRYAVSLAAGELIDDLATPKT